MSDSPLHEFSLTDADGAVHRYEVLPHPATEGQSIMLQLLATAAEPVGRLATALFSDGTLLAAIAAAEGEKAGEAIAKGAPLPAKVASVLDVDLGLVLERLDLGRLGADVKTAILTMPMDKLGADVLRHTMRDGQKLSGRVAFDAAYTRNYFEYARAVWEVVSINRFLPLSAISGLVKGRT